MKVAGEEPSGALKWAPEDAPMPPAPARQETHAESAETAEAPARQNDHAEFAENAEASAQHGIVWLLDDPALTPRPVPVKVLLNNGSDAAVEPLNAGEIAEGARVVTRATEVLSGKGAKATGSGAAQGSGNSNPFLPKMPRPPRRAGGPPPG